MPINRRRHPGRLIRRTRPLTDDVPMPHTYPMPRQLVAVDFKSSTTSPIAMVASLEEALARLEGERVPGIAYYVVEDESILYEV